VDNALFILKARVESACGAMNNSVFTMSGGTVYGSVDSPYGLDSVNTVPTGKANTGFEGVANFPNGGWVGRLPAEGAQVHLKVNLHLGRKVYLSCATPWTINRNNTPSGAIIGRGVDSPLLILEISIAPT
jgi:hypothetical protein